MRFRGTAAKDWVVVEDPELPRPIEIRLEGTEDGELKCTGLRIESNPDQELTARALRKIPLATILTEAAKRARAMGYNPAATVVQSASLPRPARPGRKGYPDSHYRKVAREYQRVKRTNARAPIQALAATFNVSEPTVHRWLQGARKRDFLEAT